jgi:Outer membrane protein beta-barrel domain
MKSFYTCALAVLCIYGAAAQTEKGNWMVGGNINLAIVSDNSEVGLNPQGGYFIINNFAIGATVTMEYNKIGENSTTTFGAGPFSRFYFGTKNVRPFAHGELNFVSVKLKVPSTTNTENGNNYFLAGGLAFFLNENVALETLLGYTHTKISGIEGDGGVALRIGFQVYLHPRSAIDQIRNE